jgi:hypothetical protein
MARVLWCLARSTWHGLARVQRGSTPTFPNRRVDAFAKSSVVEGWLDDFFTFLTNVVVVVLGCLADN